MAASQDEVTVIRDFRHSNQKAPYEDTHYRVGDLYTHPVQDIQISPEGPDGKGPVLAVKKKAAPSTTANQEK